MFKKLISNLPFNPSLYDQVSFYAARMRADASLRRAGFLFMALAFAVQLTAAMYPAQKSLATSPNDVLQSVNTKSDLLKNWDANINNVQEVYVRFGITRQSLEGIKGEAPDTKIKSADSDYWTVGQRPLADYGVSSSKWGERSVNTGSKTVYQRPLHALDTTKREAEYSTFHGKTSGGADFYIIQGCGNPTFHGPYIPSPPKAKLSVHKSLLTGATAHPGDTVKYRLEYQNTVKDSLATGFMVRDSIDSRFELVSLTDMSGRNGNDLYITHGNTLGYTPTAYVSTLIVKVKASAAAGTVICNSASASSLDSTATSPEKPCLTVVSAPSTDKSQVCPPLDSGKIDVSGSHPTFTIKAPTGYLISRYCVKAGSINQGLGPEFVDVKPYSASVTIKHSSGKDISHYSYSKVKASTPNPPPPQPKPQAGYCVATAKLVAGSTKDAVVHTQVYDIGSAKVVSYSYDVDANGSIEYSDKTAEVPHDRIIANLPPGVHKIQVNTTLSDGTVLKCCPAEVHASEDARVVLSKSVTNITQNKSNANGTTVKSGDELEFKIKTENVTSADYINFKGQDYFGSVLQYATIADRSQLATQGITLDTNGNLSWTTGKIKAGGSDVKTIRVKVKQITPATNTPSASSPDYACKISNNYGNEVTMNVECPIVKQLAESATTLPNTGSGTSVMIGAVVTVLAGYLFARSRLISRELALVRQNYISTAGE